MGKRKRSKDDYDSLLVKLKKIEERIRKRHRSRSSTSASASESEYEYPRYYELGFDAQETGEEIFEEDTWDQSKPESAESGAGPSAQAAAPQSAPPPTAAAPSPGPAPPAGDAASPAPRAVPACSTPGDQTTTSTADTPQVILIDDDNPPLLEPEILELLGEDPTCQNNYGENLHKDIAPRWAHILTNGLPKDTQQDLIKRYLPPQNCPNVKAPKLNLEIKAALLDINVKKDLYSQNKQNQLGSSLAAIGQVLNWALSSKGAVPQDIIRTLSDAGRLICDNHYRESQSRRYSALNTLNKSVRETMRNTKIDEQLFGTALSEHIKSSKAIDKTGSEIKSTQRPYKPPAVMKSRSALNSGGAPPRIPTAAEGRAPPARRPPRDRRAEPPPPPPPPRGRRYAAPARQPRRRR